MQRYLKVGITKVQETDVYLLVDDQDPRFAKAFGKPGTGKLGRNIFSVLKDVVDDAADDTLSSMDWDCDDDDIEIVCVGEVPADELIQYKAWNTITNDLVHKEDIDENGDESKHTPDPNQ